MRTTIDKKGRLLIPKALRDHLGLDTGEVEVTADENVLRIQALARRGAERQEELVVIPRSGRSLSDDTIRALRDSGQR